MTSQYFKNLNKNATFVFYDSWPNFNNAERELLKRIEYSCMLSNIEFITISNNSIINLSYHPLFNKNINDIDTKYIDAIISLHWESPKNTKHFTLSVLWHPLEHYHKDFNRITEVLKSDGFLLSGSPDIDNYFKSITNKPFFTELYTTLSFPIYGLNIKDDMRCFYVGINWDLITNSKGRYTDLLKLLDNENLVNIYGPKILHNINVWSEYKNYIDEIKFNGTAVITEIKKCGLCLVLNSNEHCNSGIVSMRIFEALSAGVPIIANKNKFLENTFSDNIFYIDTNNETEAFYNIKNIITYILDNKDIVYNKLKKCRDIFINKFLLHNQLIDLKYKIDSYKKLFH
jgi:glycosyltransferase involved in cell wall biosynthesis